MVDFDVHAMRKAREEDVLDLVTRCITQGGTPDVLVIEGLVRSLWKAAV